MIRSQVVVLNVIYDDADEEDAPPKDAPAIWDWSALVDEPIRNAVEVLAAGPLKDHDIPGDALP